MSKTPTVPPIIINVPAHSEQSVLIDRAANQIGLTPSDFVLGAACREAEEIVLDQIYFPLDEREYSRFAAMLQHPPAPCDGLIDLMDVSLPWE